MKVAIQPILGLRKRKTLLGLAERSKVSTSESETCMVCLLLCFTLAHRARYAPGSGKVPPSDMLIRQGIEDD